MVLFDKRSSPWRSVAEASLLNHEPLRFKKRGSNLIRKVKDKGSWAQISSRFEKQKKNKKKTKKNHAGIGHQNFAAAVKKL